MEEKRDWFKQLAGKVSLSSDAFFPFPDNVWRAVRSGVGHIAAPSGSVMDQKVIETADESNAVYVFTDLRFVLHSFNFFKLVDEELTSSPLSTTVSSPTKFSGSVNAKHSILMYRFSKVLFVYFCRPPF